MLLKKGIRTIVLFWVLWAAEGLMVLRFNGVIPGTFSTAINIAGGIAVILLIWSAVDFYQTWRKNKKR